MSNFQFQPKPLLTKEEYVYATLRAAIMHCDLKPGARLVIDSLSDELGVSPIPIRGALQRLQAEGLVEITPHSGAVVSEIFPETIHEVFLLLEVLESAAFRVAIPKANEAEIEQLRQLVGEMDKSLQESDVNRWSDLNNQFHLAVARITGMKMLLEFTGRTLDSWDRLRRCFLPSVVSSRPFEAQAEHRQMIELIEQRQVDSLLRLAAQHNRHAKETYQQLIKDQSRLIAED